jgi:glycosyltransferase involved in cell wall biosynthesis
MKIVFLARLFHPHVGGVEKHVLELSKSLIKKGHEITVITETPDTDLQNQKFNTNNYHKLYGIKVYRISGANENKLKKFRIWINLWHLRKILKSAEIVHCHDVFYWYLPFRFIFPSKPVYTTFHGYESFPISKKAKIIRKVSEKLSLGNICIGDFIPKWYGTKANLISYGAAYTPKKSENPSKQINDPDSAVFFGRLDDQTGILEYLKTAELIKKKIPSFKLLVIGGGKYKNLIYKKTKIIDFLEKPEKYLIQSRFAFVSRYLSILEAFAARKLVFAFYDNPVKEDYLRLSPLSKFIIIQKEPEKMAKQVIYYINNPEKEKELVSRAYSWVKKRNWDSLANSYLSLWSRHLYISKRQIPLQNPAKKI